MNKSFCFIMLFLILLICNDALSEVYPSSGENGNFKNTNSEISHSLNISIFPNPNSNMLNLNFSYPVSIQKISIRNITGNIMLYKIPDNDLMESYYLNVTDLIKGVYFIQLEFHDGTINFIKFVKE